MTKSERLALLIGMPIEFVENEIDKGMVDILIELNEKGYYTTNCCEGHLRDNEDWNGYICFAYPYKFPVYPKNFSSVKKRQYYYWNGNGEQSRQTFLNELLAWAKTLPVKKPIEKKQYVLIGKNKKRPNSRDKILISTSDYEDIKIILNRADMVKYDLRINESVIGRY